MTECEPIAAIKTHPAEAQGEPTELRPVPFYSHPDLGASVSLIGFRGNTSLRTMQRTTST